MFKNMKVGKRLGIVFGIILSLMIVQIGIGFYGVGNLDDKLERIAKVNVKKIDISNKIRNACDNIFFNVAQIVVTESASVREGLEEEDR